MENASRALLMAAGALVGILVLSIAVYLFISFGSVSAELHKKNYEQQIEQFNSQFTVYEGKDDVTIYDVITVANLASENNIYYELPYTTDPDGTNDYIKVFLIDDDIYPDTSTAKSIEKAYKYSGRINYNELISKDIEYTNGDLTKYTCKIDISTVTKRVYLVHFEKK